MRKFCLGMASILFGLVLGLLLAEIGARVYYASLPKEPSYTKNSEGYRDRDHSRTKEAGTVRIAFVGDSYTFGEMVAQEDIFPEVTERLLRKRFPEKRFEVMNFGVRGADMVRNLNDLREATEKYGPDILFLCFVPNDFTDDEQFRIFVQNYRNAEKRLKILAPLEKYSQLARFLDWTIFQFRGNQRSNHLVLLNQSFMKTKNPFYHQKHRALREAVREISLRKGAVLFFPYFLSHDEKDLFYYRQGLYTVKGVCDAQKVPFLEVWENLKDKPFNQWWASPLNHHPNREAHARTAQLVVETLVREGMIPETEGMRAEEGAKK